jgi:integrase
MSSSTQRRSRRSGIEDLWVKTVRDADGTMRTVPSVRDGRGMRWRARYVDERGGEHSKAFGLKADARGWLDGQIAAVVSGTHVAPRDAQLTVEQWCDLWTQGYGVHRASTVRSAKVHIRQIVSEFGSMQLSALRPSQIKTWVARLQAEDGMEASYIYRLHSRLSQICADAVHDGVLGRNPCSRRTSPPMGKAKVYVATTEQVWAIHDEVPDHLRAAVLLGAFAGLRIAEVCGLQTTDVDFIRGVVHPKQQWTNRGGPARFVPLKTEGSSQPIPIPRDLALLLSASVQRYPANMMVTAGLGTDRCSVWVIEKAMRTVRGKIEGLPDTFSFHDLRHYLASLLIASGADIKTVQARMRHASATTTLDTYGHLWPDADESTRTAIGAVIAERMKTAAYPLRTETPC